MTDLKHSSIFSKNPIILIKKLKNEIGFCIEKKFSNFRLDRNYSFEKILTSIFITCLETHKNGLLFSTDSLFKMCGKEECMVDQLYKEFLYFLINDLCKCNYEENTKTDVKIHIFMSKCKKNTGLYMKLRYTRDTIPVKKTVPSLINLYKFFKIKKDFVYDFDNNKSKDIIRNIVKKHLDKYGEVQRLRNNCSI